MAAAYIGRERRMNGSNRLARETAPSRPDVSSLPSRVFRLRRLNLRAAKSGAHLHAASTVALLLMAVLAAGGCNDHRIGLGEFLLLQQQIRDRTAESPSADQVRETSALLDRKLGPYRVGPGDVLFVTLVSTDDAGLFPPVNVRVNYDNEIVLPIVGTLNVADLPLMEVEEVIHRSFVPAVLTDASVHVTLAEAAPTNVMVIGAVTAPGMVRLRRTERNLLFAIIGAGGASDLASGKVTLVRLRTPSQALTLELTDPRELQSALALEPLADGDIVTVHAAAPNTIFVGGLVNAPQAQFYSPGVQISVLQSIAAAGGLRTDIYPREGTLIRRLPDGSDVHVKLDLTRIATAKDPNILLAAGDILWVPHTPATRIQDFINRNIFLRAGVSVNYTVTGVEFLNRRSLQSNNAGGGDAEQAFDPFGFLTRNATLQSLTP